MSGTQNHVHLPKTLYSLRLFYRWLSDYTLDFTCRQHLLRCAKSGPSYNIKYRGISRLFEVYLVSSEKWFLSVECKSCGPGLQGWRDVLYPRVIYSDSPLTHRVYSMSKLILGTSRIHHSSSSEALCVVRHVACHWIAFGKLFSVSLPRLICGLSDSRPLFSSPPEKACRSCLKDRQIKTKWTLLSSHLRVC